VGDCFDLRCWPIGQGFSGSRGGERGVADPRRLGLSATEVVEEHCRSHDCEVSSFGSPDALCQPQDAQHVIEVVNRIGVMVKTPCFSDGYHTFCNRS
jgi:hypothetical protein